MALALTRKMLLKNTLRFRTRNLQQNLGPSCGDKRRKGLVIGIYSQPDNKLYPGNLTQTGEKYDRIVKGQIMKTMSHLVPPPASGEVRILYGLEPEYSAVAVVGLGKECLGYDSFEQMDEGKEAIRIAAGSAVKALQQLPLTKLCVESFGHAESAAEGAALGVWLYQEKKAKERQIYIPMLELYDDCDWTGWQIGLQKAAAQNLARQLMDTPANAMTPTSFAQNAVEVLCKSGVNVEVKVRGWAETQKMNAFLAVAKGSCEPPIFLELSYYGASRDERPVVLIGKGITYNSGGLCLKTPKQLTLMRGDMGGAACVVAACRAVAGLQLPINVRGLIPLCENMPGCAAMRPGDIVQAMNGKTIHIQTTDCAGHLMLADALVYAQSFWPRFIVDIGTMGMDIRTALGPAASGVFTNSEALWEYMLAASMHTGDRVWRLPLWDHFTHLLTQSQLADVNTHGNGPKWGIAGACRAAAFLNEFVPCGDWMHIDTQGVLRSTGSEFKYLRAGMAGRPTRTLVEFLSQLVCHKE